MERRTPTPTPTPTPMATVLELLDEDAEADVDVVAATPVVDAGPVEDDVGGRVAVKASGIE